MGIFYQDIKERKVFVWLLLISALCMGYLHFNHVLAMQFYYAILINSVVVLVLIAVLFLYAKMKLKSSLEASFGLGDFLFFMAIAIGFPTVTFSVLFSFSLIFSLLLFLVLKNRLRYKTVPLAGFQALFFGLIFLLNWAFNFTNLYQY